MPVLHLLLVDFGEGWFLLLVVILTGGETKSTPTPSNRSSDGSASSEWSLTKVSMPESWLLTNNQTPPMLTRFSLLGSYITFNNIALLF